MMTTINWTVVIVVGIICYTLWAIADLNHDCRMAEAGYDPDAEDFSEDNFTDEDYEE